LPFERPQSGRRAVLVHVEVSQRQDGEELQEFRELAVSGQYQPAAIVCATLREPNPKFLIGSGKIEEIRAAVAAHEAGIVLFNHTLSPAQERNIERELKCAVMDRTGLILDIFAQRARSHEGRLQVELAQLEHLSTRLVRGWTHLERQRGGIGVRGGPGETQIELDRRMIRERIKQLTKKLGKVGKRRELNRATRRKVPIPTVSLVGYTNAGKSTLFNQLTRANVYAADQLFATLDPTLRRLELPHAKSVILADTVGFIRHLPHSLVTAFHATLEETAQANLLLHVVDAHSEQRHSNIDEVNTVLREIGADDVRQIEVFNKIDLIPGEQTRVERDANGVITRVWVSAATGAGMAELTAAIGEFFQQSLEALELRVPVTQARLRAALHALGVVVEESLVDDTVWRIVVEVEPDQRSALVHHPDFRAEMLVSGRPEPDESKRLAGVA
jgi:GTP-binding protein HflX